MSELTRLNEQKEREPCLKGGGGGEIKITVMQWTNNRKVVLDLLMAGWGLGTWLGVNGLYVQLPLLVQRLPEQWALPSSMVLAVQLANAGLLFYAIARRLFRNTKDTIYIYCLLTIGLLSLSLNSFLYPRTAMIGSSERSVAFLSLTFFAALVGCTSSVLFYPYLRHFRDVYLATYLVGEGLSGFLPSIIAIIQGVGGDPECVPSADNSTLVPVFQEPLFNPTVFFIILAGLSAVSLFSFILIDNCKVFDSERVTATAVAKDDEAQSVRESLVSPKWVCVLALTACLNALSNGVLPSVQSYSCMPYGSTAYHLAVTLGAMANPAACLAGIWLKPISPAMLATTLGATLVPLCYILATALLSPSPPLQHLTIGTILIVASWVITSGVVSYGRMWVYGWARRGGARGMRACGALTQLGSALGSLLLFLLVNYANIFISADSQADCAASLTSNVESFNL